MSESAAGAAEKAKLDGFLVRGIAWTAGVKWGVQILNWISTLIVARLLSPDDYGLVGMAMVYFGLVALVHEFGFSASVIAKHELTPSQISQINCVCVVIGVAGFLVSCAMAYPLSLFFRAPELTMIVPVMATSFLVGSFEMIPNALLQRELEFKLLAGIDAIRAIVHSAVMVTLAALGFGFWSLVIGGIVGTVVKTGLAVLKRRHAFAWPRLGSFKEALTFSGHVFVSRLSWYAVSQTDFMIAGRVLGKTVLGTYTLGWTLATLPVEKITAIVARVTYPFFSSIQNDVQALRRYFLTITEGLAMLAFPTALGLSLVAEEFILVVLGEKWADSVWPLRLLALSTVVRAIDPLMPQALLVRRGSRLVMRVGIACGVAMPLSFYIGSRWGAIGIASAWCLIYPLVTLPLYRGVFRALEFSALRYLKALWPAASAASVMTVAILACKAAVPESWSLAWHLAIQILVGGAAYVLTAWALHRQRLVAFIKTIRSSRS